MSKALVCLFLLYVGAVIDVEGHARVADPPQRGSLWRHPEYAWADPGHQADDYELICGTRSVTDPYVGACGLCGDSLLEAKPRKHEIGGLYDRGIITRTYGVGQTISVEIDINVHHGGWHEFRLCPYSTTGQESEECFNQNLLRFSDGSTRQLLSGRASIVLPAGVRCDRCVLQWHWYGEGSKQYYRNCVDIAIQ